MVSVAYFTTFAKETTYQVELAAALDEFDDISITIYSLFMPGDVSHDVEVELLEADSRFEPGWMLELYRILTSDRHDVFHTHPAVAGSFVRIIATIARYHPILSTEHTTHRWYGPLKRLVVGSTIGLNDVLITNSRSTLESLQWWEKGLVSVCGTEPIVIYNGVNVDAIDAASTAEGPRLPGGFLIGTVSRLVDVKNHRELLLACERLLARHDDLSIVIVGDGEERESLELLVQDLGIDNRVRFLGQLSRPEVYAVLHRLDLFALPSEHEGFGNAAVEAMVAGVPVVANDIPALREVLGEAGVFTDATNIDEFAETLDELYQDDDLRQATARAANARGREFSIDVAAARHADLYRRLAAGESPATAVTALGKSSNTESSSFESL